jgi:hypothetical protein
MRNSQVFKLMDLIEDMKKVDKLIRMHGEDQNSSIMSSQYESKKSETYESDYQ